MLFRNPTARPARRPKRRNAAPRLEPLDRRVLPAGPVSLTPATVQFPDALIDNQPRTTTLPRFNPNLGQLVGVTLSSGAGVHGTVDLKNLHDDPTTVALVMNGQFNLTVDGFGATMTDSASVNVPGVALPGFDGILGFTGPGKVTVGPDKLSTAHTLNRALSASTSDLSAFIGPGTLSVVFDPRGVTQLAENNGNIAVRTRATADATASIQYTYIPFAISGYVYDSCASPDGLRSPSEPGIPGVLLTLTGVTAGGLPVGPLTTTTDANGFYRFDGLRAGTYTVTETQPAGWLDGLETRGNVTALPGSLGTDAISQIVVGGSVLEAVENNFGELKPSLISGFVYRDSQRADDTFDGIRNPSDSDKLGNEWGIGNVLLTLTGTDDMGQSVNRTTRTNADGFYIFDNLRPGTYTVNETQPTAATNPTPLFNYADGLDSQGNLAPIPGSNATDAIGPIVLVSCGESTNNNFGEILPLALPPEPPPKPQPGETCVGVTPHVRGIHDQPTPIEITFTVRLATSRARNLANYRLTQSGPDHKFGTADDRVIRINSVLYNAAKRMVILRPAERLQLNTAYKLFIKGPGGLFTKSSRTGLKGEDGRCGNYEAILQRGTHLHYNDRDGDFVTLGASKGGVLELIRKPNGEAARLFVLRGSPGGPGLKTGRNFVIGSVTRQGKGDGRARIIRVIQAVPIDLRLKKPPFRIASVKVDRTLPPSGLPGS
jgi:hypothetical protein